ncbi:MAG: NADH-quinone oxidoreductase subunit NuoB [Spirochaetes bacterium]|nr:NADH-quinone oxidoreductase subunit NuoB [Spirochaetota bacterium]
MGIKEYCFKKSLWVFHIAASPCNNCDIEILDCLTPRYDIERFGMLLTGSIKHADVLLVTGMVNKKAKKRVKELYDQVPKPCVVVAVGTCPSSGILFKESYNFAGPLDKVIPVDVYIPGCPPKPEAIIAGIVKFLNKK